MSNLINLSSNSSLQYIQVSNSSVSYLNIQNGNNTNMTNLKDEFYVKITLTIKFIVIIIGQVFIRARDL